MPIYEYECSGCGSRFDRRQRFDEEPIAICPLCSSKARRIIHSVPIVFKGSGFYCTDHGSSTRHNPGPKYEDVEAKDEPRSEAKADTKSTSDTKSATKAESKSGKSD